LIENDGGGFKNEGQKTFLSGTEVKKKWVNECKINIPQ